MRVAVSGIGVVTATGLGQHNVQRALLAGIDGARPVRRFGTSKLKVHNAFEVSEDLLPSAPGITRLAQLGYAAAREALADAGLTGDCEDVVLLVGSGLGDEEVMLRLAEDRESLGGEPLQSHKLGLQLANLLGIGGGVIGNGTACAAGLTAIATGFDLIRNGECEAVIAGGAETFCVNSMAYFDRVSVTKPVNVRPFDKDRQGMLLGEGAGFVVLESWERVERRKRRHHGEVLGYGLSCDAHHLSNMSVDGVASAISRALDDSGLTPGEIDYIAAHGTGTPINDVTETNAIKVVYKEQARHTPISSIKSMIGHTGGASGAIGLISGLFAIAAQTLPPTINYQTRDPECDLDYVPNVARRCAVRKTQVNSFGFGGANCSVIVGA